MRRSKFTEQEAGEKTGDVCRRRGVSSATFYAWKAKYGDMEVADAKRLKALGEENGKLKRLLAEAMLDSEPLSAIGPRTVASALKDLLGRKW